MMMDSANSKMSIQDFEIIRVIGKGYMGKVMVVREKSTGLVFAIKSIHKKTILEKREVDHTFAERNILTELVTNPPHCTFLIKIHRVFQDRQNIYYLMDFHGGGDMAGLLGQMIRLPEGWVRLYAAQIALALIELHERGIVYRDLKPENILLSEDGYIVLTDFGLSKSLIENPQGTKTFCGTPEYLAPEVLKRQWYGMSIDWWSFGILLYEMLIGMTPFWDENPSQMYSKILSGQAVEMPINLSRQVKDLIRKCLHPDPGKRICDREILSHPFFDDLDWGKGSKLDLRAFDTSFTSLPPIITPDDNTSHINASLKEKIFRGFSFKP